MSETINETCSCGATFEFRGDYAMTAAGAFRKAHADCRKKPSVVASAVRSAVSTR